MGMLREVLERLKDPASTAGTARWVALGVLAYDCAARGASLYNLAGLLVLAGLPHAPGALDWLRGLLPPAPPTLPPTAAA
jgi:hypothetical protein